MAIVLLWYQAILLLAVWTHRSPGFIFPDPTLPWSCQATLPVTLPIEERLVRLRAALVINVVKLVHAAARLLAVDVDIEDGCCECRQAVESVRYYCEKVSNKHLQRNKGESKQSFVDSAHHYANVFVPVSNITFVRQCS